MPHRGKLTWTKEFTKKEIRKRVKANKQKAHNKTPPNNNSMITSLSH